MDFDVVRPCVGRLRTRGWTPTFISGAVYTMRTEKWRFRRTREMTVKIAKGRPGLAGMEAFFVIDQNRSSANWPLAKILQRYVTRRLGLSGSLTSSPAPGGFHTPGRYLY